MTRTILAVGAYERDNFGDYLFLEILKRALPNDIIVPGSTIFSEVRDGHGTVTVPFDYALENQKFNAIVVVGGEIGGVDTNMALGMSLPDNTQKIINRQSSFQGHKDMINSVYGVLRYHACAYVPDMSGYPLNSQTPLIINSVGISLFGDNKQAKKVFRRASFISVRESSSVSNLKRWDIKQFEHAPDVVHVLPTLYTPQKQSGEYIVVQINQFLFQQWGMETVTKILKKIHKKYGHKIVLLIAGSTRGHDSLKLYKTLTKSLEGTCEIEIAASLTPLKIVDLIAGAKATVSTSLHVRIISAGYGVPRVSLENEKVTRYASEWDSTFPYSTKDSDVIDALEHAFKQSQSNESIINNRATELAKENLGKALGNISSEPIEFNEALFYKKGLFFSRDALLSTIADNAKHTQTLDAAIKSKDLQIADYHDQLIKAGKLIDEIMGSNAWKLVTRYREAATKTKRSISRKKDAN